MRKTSWRGHYLKDQLKVDESHQCEKKQEENNLRREISYAKAHKQDVIQHCGETSSVSA